MRVAVIVVVTQEHFRCGESGPFSDRVHLDRPGLLVGEQGRIEFVPRNVLLHIPADGFQRFIKFRIKHGVHCPPLMPLMRRYICIDFG